jgi:SH3-like domain-containing protein
MLGLSMRGVWLGLAMFAAMSVGSARWPRTCRPVPVTGLPVPRYVSLKSDRVNLREGPSKEHRTRWVYQRAGLPVEIVAEFETWRRVRDADGSEGWVLHSLLSGRRTALVAPWSKAKDETFTLRASADESLGRGGAASARRHHQCRELRQCLVPRRHRQGRGLSPPGPALGRLSQ